MSQGEKQSSNSEVWQQVRPPSDIKSEKTTQRPRLRFIQLPGWLTFVNENLCPYYKGLWSKCKAIKNKNKLHQFYTINVVIRVKLVEHGPVKAVTCTSNLEELFPDIDLDDL